MTQPPSFYIKDELIRASIPFQYKDIGREVPGRRWDGEAKEWTWPLSQETARQLALVFGALRPKMDKLFSDLSLTPGAEIRFDNGGAAYPAAPLVDDLADYPWKSFKPWLLQRRQFYFGKDKSGVLIPLKMGRGKSRVAVDILTARGHKTVLIMCPVSVMNVWPRELVRHAMDDWNVCVLDQRNVEKRKDEAVRALQLAQIRDQKIAVVINHEAAWRPPFCDFALSTDWDAVLVDEGHRGKSPDGKFSTFLRNFSSHRCQRLVLTGTPMPHSPLDLWAQYRFLAPEIYGTSFYLFKSRYCVTQPRTTKDGRTFKEVVGYQNQEDFRERMLRIQLPMDEAEDIELPETLHLERWCKFDEKAQKIYDELETKFYVEVEQGIVTPANAMVRLLRLQQLTSGYVVPDGVEPDEHPDPVSVSQHKESELEDVLIDIEEPVVVFCRFRHDLAAVERVAGRLGRRYGELSGPRKDLLDNQAVMRRDIDIGGVQIQAGGVGVDLTPAAVAVYYSLGFNLAEYLQSLARVHRPGQKRKVTYIHLLTEGTVDTQVYKALENRADIIKAIMEGRKNDKHA